MKHNKRKYTNNKVETSITGLRPQKRVVYNIWSVIIVGTGALKGTGESDSLRRKRTC